MTWKPIVVGVDASSEAAVAAALAHRLGAALGATCYLVHAARDAWASLALDEGGPDLRRALIDDARLRIAAALQEAVPREVLGNLTIRWGRAPTVLREAVADVGAELVVLGGKHHSALGRWLGGSTSLNVVRTTDVPLLVTAGSAAPIRRVLAAVDLSGAARPTLEAAERFAGALGAELRVLNVIEPLPVIPEVTPPYDTAAYYLMAEEQVRREVWSLIRGSGVERVIRSGAPVEVIAHEVGEWHADLLVVGSHGRGWAERMLVGSVTERLLNALPTSLLVVPAAVATVAVREERAAAVAQPLVAIA